MAERIRARRIGSMPAGRRGHGMLAAGTLLGAAILTGAPAAMAQSADATRAAAAEAAAAAAARADTGTGNRARGVSYAPPPVSGAPSGEQVRTVTTTSVTTATPPARLAQSVPTQPLPPEVPPPVQVIFAPGTDAGVIVPQASVQAYPLPYPAPYSAPYGAPYPAPYPPAHAPQGADDGWGRESWPGRDADLDRLCGHGGRTIGAIAGGVVGGIVGNRVAGRGDRAVGTVIGAVGGAAVGGAFGDAADRDRCTAYAQRYATWRQGAYSPPYGHVQGHGYAHGYAYQGGAVPYGYMTPGYVVTTIIEDAGVAGDGGGDLIEEVTTTTYEHAPAQVRRAAPRKVHRAKPRPKPRPRCICR